MRTGKVRAEGQLRHRFWGEYSAVIALVFEDAASAADALRVLGEPWAIGSIETRVLVAVFTSAGLDVEKQRLGTYGADVKKIDSVAKSIDYGEPFAVTIDVTPAEQLSLLGVAS
jgi:hypothetical protein